MKTQTSLTVIALILSTVLSAQIIYVPTDQPTIQDGIFAAQDGDTVVVEEGTYVENINFWLKAITVASRFILDGNPEHITNTIIDGSEPEDPNYGTVVTFESGEDTSSVIMGFTITGGSGTFVASANIQTGGGIICNNSGATILNNNIEYNEIDSYYYGSAAGIAVGPPDTYAYTIIKNNQIHDNSVTANDIAYAGGVELRATGLFEGNEVFNNSVESQNLHANGGGLFCGGWDSPSICDIINNYFHHNEAYSYTTDEISCQGGGIMIAKNSGIVYNISHITGPTSIMISYHPSILGIQKTN